MMGELGSIERVGWRYRTSLTAVDVKVLGFQFSVKQVLAYTSRPQANMPGVPCTLMSPLSRAATQSVIKQIIHAPSFRYSSIVAIVLQSCDSSPPSCNNKHLLASDHLVASQFSNIVTVVGGYRLVNIVTVVKEEKIATKSPRGHSLRATLTVACRGLADTCRAFAAGCLRLADAATVDAVKDETIRL